MPKATRSKSKASTSQTAVESVSKGATAAKRLPKNGASRKDKALAFDYSRDWEQCDCRASPELYRVGRGEQGVFAVQPYKGELLPLWKFATPDIARKSSAALKAKFEEYKEAGDFPGCDMARKFIQMGFTRSRRYANHAGGRKYDEDGEEKPRSVEDPVKAESARIFKEVLEEIKADEEYKRLGEVHETLVRASLKA